jgi:hypothetical protein
LIFHLAAAKAVPAAAKAKMTAVRNTIVKILFMFSSLKVEV